MEIGPTLDFFVFPAKRTALLCGKIILGANLWSLSQTTLPLLSRSCSSFVWLLRKWVGAEEKSLVFSCLRPTMDYFWRPPLALPLKRIDCQLPPSLPSPIWSATLESKFSYCMQSTQFSSSSSSSASTCTFTKNITNIIHN